MDFSNQAGGPDLDTVLRTLAQLAGQPVPPPTSTTPTSTPPSLQPSAGPLVPPTNRLDAPSASSGHAPANALPQYSRISTPTIDPGTIVQWTQGLRYVSKLAAQNLHFEHAIRAMMSEQEKHELMWWQGRQRLMESHKIGSANAPNISEKAREELKIYDAKVYKAAQCMFKAMSTELKQLGVPFFEVRDDLIVPLREANAGDASKITKEELQALQKRMIQYLEDMYRN